MNLYLIILKIAQKKLRKKKSNHLAWVAPKRHAGARQRHHPRVKAMEKILLFFCYFAEESHCPQAFRAA